MWRSVSCLLHLSMPFFQDEQQVFVSKATVPSSSAAGSSTGWECGAVPYRCRWFERTSST